MGRTVREIETVLIQRIHTFHCDECNEYLGEQAENDDGYVTTIGSFEHKIFFEGAWWAKRGILCDKCRAAFVNELAPILQRLRYMKD